MAKKQVMRIGMVPIVRPLFRGARMGLEEKSRKALAGLGPKLGFEITYAAPLVSDGEIASRTAKEIEGRPLDLLLVQQVTFATGDLILPFLELPIPAAVWALPEVSATGPLMQNAFCGLNLALSLPMNRKLPVKWLYGNVEDEWFQRRLTLTVQALRGYKALREGKLLLIGGAAPGFYRLEFGTVPIAVEKIPLEELFSAWEKVTPSEVQDRLGGVDEPSDLPLAELSPMIRVELALERVAAGYSGAAIRCWPEVPNRAGSMACGAIARLSDRGMIFACEGDLAGVASMVALRSLTGEDPLLLDLSHFEAEGLLFWHCGNAPRSWASGPTRFIPHFNLKIPAVRDMRLKPGPVCGLRFLEDQKTMVYSGRVQDRPDGIHGVSGWVKDLRWAQTPLTPRGFLASVLNHRLPHHFPLGRGDGEAALMELCEWLGYKPLRPLPEEEILCWPNG